MTWVAFLGLVGVAAAIFVLGGIAGWQWMHTRGTEATEQRINMALSVFFTVVALLVVADLIVLTHRFNTYVSQTMARDTAQEKCNADTLEVLKGWIEFRTTFVSHDPATPGDYVTAADMEQYFKAHPFPDCEVRAPG